MSDVALTGLAKQLVVAELLNEKAALDAHQKAQRSKIPLVSYLVQNKVLKSLVLAVIASEQFGLPFMDLSTLDKEAQPKGLVSEKTDPSAPQRTKPRKAAFL